MGKVWINKCDICNRDMYLSSPRPDTKRIYDIEYEEPLRIGEPPKIRTRTKNLCMRCDDAEADRRGEARAGVIPGFGDVHMEHYFINRHNDFYCARCAIHISDQDRYECEYRHDFVKSGTVWFCRFCAQVSHYGDNFDVDKKCRLFGHIINGHRLIPVGPVSELQCATCEARAADWHLTCELPDQPVIIGMDMAEGESHTVSIRSGNGTAEFTEQGQAYLNELVKRQALEIYKTMGVPSSLIGSKNHG